MVNYFAGFITCWLILGLFSFIGDWQEWYHSDRFWGVLCFPVIVFAAPFYFLFGLLIWHPWKNVFFPVTSGDFDRCIAKADGCKVYPITETLYFCVELGAKRIYNKLFFVRIMKEVVANGPY